MLVLKQLLNGSDVDLSALYTEMIDVLLTSGFRRRDIARQRRQQPTASGLVL